MNTATYIQELEKTISTAIYKETGNYIRLSENPNYDNKEGGYNAQVFFVDVVGNPIKVESYKLSTIKSLLRSIPDIKRAKISPAYNKKFRTVFAIGLGPNYTNLKFPKK